MGKGYNDKEAIAEKPEPPPSKEFPSVRVDKTQNMDDAGSDGKKAEKIENCVTWSKNILKNARISSFTQEYRENKEYKPPVSHAVSASHGEKNRYRHIYCADENRVILKDRDKDNDYIHASWMKMPDDVQFISTQGPIERTLEDFWHMIYTEKAPVIVMLCNYIEDEQEKCHHYFDAEKEQKFGEYKVKVVEKSVELFNPVKYSVIQVTKKNSEPHLVHHYWYHNWHDQVAPLDPSPMVKMYKAVLKRAGFKPIVVHCSAGVGRTSTFVGIHFAYCMILDDPNVGMVDILKKLRKMRLGSIQSQLQYVFLVCCLIQLFIDEKYIKRDDLFEILLKKYSDVTKKVTNVIEAQENQKKKQEERELRKQEERERKEEQKEKEREERREKEKEEARKKASEVPSKGKKADKETPSKNTKKASDGKELPSKLSKNREKDAKKEEPTMNEAKTNDKKSVFGKSSMSSNEKSKYKKDGKNPKVQQKKRKKKPNIFGF